MKEKMKIKVNGTEYEVEFDRKISDEKSSKSVSIAKWITINLFRIVTLILLVILFCPTTCVYIKMKKSFCEDTVCFSEELSVITNNSQDEQSSDAIKTRQKFSCQMFYMFCFITLVIVDLVLFILFVKDKSWIKYAKLQELQLLREQLLREQLLSGKSFCEIAADISFETNDENKKSTTRGKTNNNCTALLKHYMDCVTEI